MRNLLLIAAGGAVGSIARWGLAGVIQRGSGSAFPWGTFAINAIGSLAIGVLGELALERSLVPMGARLFLITGVLGGFTTFSAFSYETLGLLHDGRWLPAALYAFGSLAVGVVAAFGGYSLAASW